MERWRGRVALVTGASAGIGQAIAEALARSGMNVIGCARRREKIEELNLKLKAEAPGSGTVTAIKCNLRNPDEILAMFERIESEFKHVDVLINNAGVGLSDTLSTGRIDRWQQMLDLNVMAVSICAREALRLMKKDAVDDGQIININSVVGHVIVPFPVAHFYNATKHMLTALTKALIIDLRQQNSKIRVTSLSPGMVETEFFDVRASDSDQQNASTQASLKGLQDAYARSQPLSAEDVADMALFVLSTKPHILIRELTFASVDQI